MSSSINLTNLANDLLCVFERTMNFMQSIGIIQAYSFSHSNIFLCPNAEKYLENFLTILEEIKSIIEKVNILKKKQAPLEVPVVDPSTNLVPGDLISASSFIQSTEIFTTEQLMTPHDDLGSYIAPTAQLNSDYFVPPEIIIEPATELSWVAPDDKEEEPVKEVVSEPVVNKEPFQCSDCGKVLSSKTTLLLHQATHTGEKPFCCEHCGKLFTTSTNLAAHLTRQHNLNTESANSCKECGKLFVRKSALKTHLKSHRGIKPWACEVCNKTFTQKITRDVHQLTHTRDYKFCCDECGKKFPTQAKLNCHMKMHKDPQFMCHFCNKKFALRQYLNAHYSTHDFSRPKAAHCRLDTVSSQMVGMDNNRVGCGQCSRTFPSQHALAVHAQRHNPLSEKRKMAPRQKHPCRECGKEFLLSASLAHHQKQNHSSGLSDKQLKPYCCHLCNKRFTLCSKARRHMLIHTQEEQHRCLVCGRMFLRKDSLQRHMSQHNGHSRTPQEPCSYATEAHLKCNQCTRSFRSNTALKFHLQSHDGKFKHQCNICGKQFVRKCHYQDHLLSHSNDRPYQCDVCGKGFKSDKKCREHTKRVHASQIGCTAPAVSREQEQSLTTNEMATSQMAIHTLLAGDDATYGQTYDQFQACVQLQ